MKSEKRFCLPLFCTLHLLLLLHMCLFMSHFYVLQINYFIILLYRGLSKILISRDITSYPALCAKVTASFSVLSDTINAAKSCLMERHEKKDICEVVNQLQKHESEKLNYTAALHLERLRLNNSELGVGNDADERAAKLLKESINTLEQKISSTVQSINEIIDELRCIAIDEE